jgi:hypothetical protein
VTKHGACLGLAAMSSDNLRRITILFPFSGTYDELKAILFSDNDVAVKLLVSLWDSLFLAPQTQLPFRTRGLFLEPNNNIRLIQNVFIAVF